MLVFSFFEKSLKNKENQQHKKATTHTCAQTQETPWNAAKKIVFISNHSWAQYLKNKQQKLLLAFS